MKIIFAQGNPGQEYATTRHNVGWIILDAYAEEKDASWKYDKKQNADIAAFTHGDEKVLLVKPRSFYNDTGLVAHRIIQFYKASPKDDLLVVHDDLALPLGTLRIREKGRDAGNNGIKSLNAHIGEQYQRIRVGVWNELKQHMNDSDFVLASFSKAEQETLRATIIPKVMTLIDNYLNGDRDPHSIQSLRLSK